MTVPFEEPLTRDAEFRAFVITYDCLLAHEPDWKHKCSGSIIAHHVKAGGIGTKCSDYREVPMCGGAHLEIDTKGKETFEKNHPGCIKDKQIEILIAWIECKNDEIEELQQQIEELKL